MIVYGRASKLSTTNARPKKHRGKVTAPHCGWWGAPRPTIEGDLVIEATDPVDGERYFMRVVSPADEELIRIARAEWAKAYNEEKRRARAVQAALLRAAERGEVVRIPTRRTRSTLSPAAEAKAQAALARRTGVLLTEEEMDARLAEKRANPAGRAKAAR